MDLRTYYAPEVEQALVALLWHEPEYLGQVQRQLDPEVHLVEPANRILLQAINVLYREVGATDWATLIDYLRQVDQLEEVGGLQHLDQIYTRPGYPSLLNYYLQLLKEYAQIRRPEPSRPSYFLSVGRGILAPNKNRTGPTSPDMVGSAKIASHFYSVSAWKHDAPDGSNPQLRLRFELEPGERRSHARRPVTNTG